MVVRGSLRAAACAMSLLIATLLAPAPASAQTAPAPNPSSIDERGVDLLSGKVIVGSTDVSIGPPDHRGLSFSRQWVNNGWRISNVPTVSGNCTNPVVSFG